MRPAPDDDVLATLTPFRRRHTVTDEAAEPAAGAEPTLWYVTVTVAGPEAEPCAVHGCLERLATERPFVVSARYRANRAEVRYWDESDDVAVVVGQALRMWSDHRGSADLPDWHVVGLEVVDRETARRRWPVGEQPQVQVLGEIRPLDDLV